MPHRFTDWAIIIGGSIFYIAVFIIPIQKIVRRAGLNGWWSLLFFIPVGNLVALWIFAFCSWPSLNTRTQ